MHPRVLEIELDGADRNGARSIEVRNGKVGLMMTGRGVAGGFVTVTIRF